VRTTAALVTTVTALGSSLAWAQLPAQTPGQTPGQTGCGPPAQTGPGQTGPGQTGPGQTGPGQTGPGQTGPGQTGCTNRPGRPGRPVVSRLRVTPKSFPALAGRRASVARRGGVRISYAVSEAGTARFTIRRLGSRIKLPGSFRYGAIRGRNELRFTGHLAGRALAPGRYILIVRVVDLTGDRSRAKRTRFRILS
jgi:hypothetical protein